MSYSFADIALPNLFLTPFTIHLSIPLNRAGSSRRMSELMDSVRMPELRSFAMDDLHTFDHPFLLGSFDAIVAALVIRGYGPGP